MKDNRDFDEEGDELENCELFTLVQQILHQRILPHPRSSQPPSLSFFFLCPSVCVSLSQANQRTGSGQEEKRRKTKGTVLYN